MSKLFFIVEHPRRGVLKDLEETNAGHTGRWNREGSRIDGMKFGTYQDAWAAVDRISPEQGRAQAEVRYSVYNPRDYLNAWPRIDREGNVIKR